MGHTQTFRHPGNPVRIVKIDVHQVRDHNVVFWKDVEIIFPGVRHVQKAHVVITEQKDENGVR